MKVAGNIETKFQCNEHGVKMTEKWNTDNTLNSTFELQVVCYFQQRMFQMDTNRLLNNQGWELEPGVFVSS